MFPEQPEDTCVPPEVTVEPEAHSRHPYHTAVSVSLGSPVQVVGRCSGELFVDTRRRVGADCRTALGAVVEREVDTGIDVSRPTRRLFAFAWQDDRGPDAFYER